MILKKQQKTYLLLGAVLIIWGTIGYQIYSRLNPSNTEFEIEPIATNFQKQKITNPILYQLKNEYRDPFLGNFPKKKRITTKRKKNIKPTLKNPFPRVVYNGIIQVDGSTSFILTINNKQEIVKTGDTFQKVKLIKANKQEAVVEFEKERKTIVKQ